MKHIILIQDEQLFRAIEAGAIVQNVSVENMTERLVRAGIEALQAGIRDRRPKATWPPSAERRTHA